jgi:hypothetical protein
MMLTGMCMPQDHNDGSGTPFFSLVDQDGSDNEPFDLQEEAFAELEEAQYASFDEALEAIRGESLEVTSLTGFSDISRNEVRRLAGIWHELPVESRVTIADHVHTLGQEDLFLDFMRFFRLLLDDDSAAVRQIVATGLAPYDDESLIEPLTKHATADVDDDVRVAAMESLGTFVTLGEFGMLEPKTMKNLRQVLLRSVEDAKAPVRLRAAALAGIAVNSDDNRIQEVIEAFYTSGDSDLRMGAIQAMGRSANPLWIPLLETTLRSADPDERQASARSLGTYDDPAVVPMLTMLAREDQEMPVRLEAIQALGTVGGRNALHSLQTLREHVSDDEIEAVDAAIAEAEDLMALEEAGPEDEYGLEEDE